MEYQRRSDSDTDELPFWRATAITGSLHFDNAPVDLSDEDELMELYLGIG